MAAPTPRAIVSKVRTFVRRYGVLRAGPLVLAVSGGTDSTALALIMRELADECGLVLHVAHFDHGMRPEAAAGEAQFVADLAARIGAPLRLGRAQRPARSEDDARRARYAFLRRAMEQAGAAAVATGHTLDDQAETVLLHLARGAGLAGAAGMRPLREGIARPLLAVTRTETAAVCRGAGIVPLEDPSNASLRFARNRVRLRVLPELAAINPKAREALARFAQAAAEADDALERAAAIAEEDPIGVAGLPAARELRERALAHAYRRVTGVTLGARHRSALVDLAAATHGTKRLDLPGAAVVREYDRLRFLRTGDSTGDRTEGRTGERAGDPTRDRAGERAGERVTDRAVVRRRAEARPLVRGAVTEWAGWRIALDVKSDALPLTGSVDAATARRLVVRGRRPGDRVSERGKLQDVFVDAKVPVALRDGWPLVAVDGVVLWVPGVTEPPRTGRVSLAAGSVGDQRGGRDGAAGPSARDRRLASSVEARQQGGKRGRR